MISQVVEQGQGMRLPAAELLFLAADLIAFSSVGMDILCLGATLGRKLRRPGDAAAVAVSLSRCRLIRCWFGGRAARRVGSGKTEERGVR